jgi:uncharacterized protein YdeI (YjbR/CyaY-like superfamily)
VEEDKRIDRFISDSREFAQPILVHLRSVVHKASPEIGETIKWGMPHFEYAGKIVCSMAAFKEHCAFAFRQATLMKDPLKLLSTGEGKSGMGHFGQIKTLKDLPSEKILIQYIREAIELIKKGAKVPKPKVSPKKIVVPKDFLALLKKNKVAHSVFEKFSQSNKRDYVEWITDARTEETRNRRMNTAIEWLKEGKSRNWKYQ